MPYRIYEQLGREDMKKVDRGITMINHTQAEAMGILTNVLCQVGVTTLIAKFLILDIPIDCDAPIVVGRGSLNVMRNAESDSDDEEEYQIKINKFGAPIYEPKPAPYLNCNDPAERSFAGDTYTTLEGFQQDPNNNNLSSILACDDLLSAKNSIQGYIVSTVIFPLNLVAIIALIVVRVIDRVVLANNSSMLAIFRAALLLIEQDPYNNSLSSILPCVDSLSAERVLNDANFSHDASFVILNRGEDGGVLLHHKIAKENPHVTFAIAAYETQNDEHFDQENFNNGATFPSLAWEAKCTAVSDSTWIKPKWKCRVAFALAWSSPKVKFMKGKSYDTHNRCNKDEKSRYNTRLAQLIPRHVYSSCVVNWDVLNRMGYDGEIDDMLRIRLREAESNEEILTSVAWIRAFNINEPIYKELCHEFYSTYEFDEVCADDELQTKKIIKFRLGGRAHSLTLLEFARRLGLYHADELEEDGFNVYFEGGLRSDEHFNAQEYWLRISREESLGLSRSHTSTIRSPILSVIHKMITYGLCQRMTGYDKIQKNDLWLLSMFDARHQNGYANVAWLIVRVLTEDVVRSLSAQIYCRYLDTTPMRDLIDSEGKLIPEDPQPGVPRVGIPRPPRASMQDLYDRMDRMEICQEAIKRMEYRQS
ncbi:retrotransposon ORF1 [Tanacetum coccineum]|uniref:Retrotransposon ORF1 n=1 Tax=Tanacetum coccineum TaxID=301880 RepID=A0ABQ4YXC7_9ASTR